MNSGYLKIRCLFKKYITLVFIGEIAVTSTNQDLISASCYAIGEIARKAPLPLPDGNLGWLLVSYFYIALKN